MGCVPMTEQRWWVACRDAFGRDRAVTVLVDHGEVVLVAPPGEAAVLSAQETTRLRSALDEAASSSDGRAAS
ncbi:hypothetical protein LX15_002437 [Streptoalloteichus tenebrarius]|uniref:Uncharacterized protein n=2 Tax=Streptoalloteichus tenebrarius (strain ATCC 17920 / DSM 40477 / JCM 4838 / CBS 697.72 / NBRC 16177 / NCIMB 11028 / NRRL B-12390 / A12253. 1 / ISP 5477) TaxID=1933 RepID=A0ABT1HTA7_STRSD|nr:hypothetical protein [Streptoalloteichus tenebrarius]